jgi:hypothetical protein
LFHEKAIAVEEVTPSTVSDAALLVPEEVFAKQRREPRADVEKTKEEKIAERKQRKRINKRQKKEKDANQKLIEKINPGLGNPYSKKKALKELEEVNCDFFYLYFFHPHSYSLLLSLTLTLTHSYSLLLTLTHSYSLFRLQGALGHM